MWPQPCCLQLLHKQRLCLRHYTNMSMPMHMHVERWGAGSMTLLLWLE
jgi:hypothetical protein